MILHTNSYYADSIDSITEYPRLEEDIQADVCIVGAGFSGLSAAIHLAEKGFSVVLLESAKVGYGATGRNGGQLVNSYSRDVDVIEKRYKPKLAQALCGMIFEGGDIIRDLIARYNIECEYKAGGIFAALNSKHQKALVEHKSNWERYGSDQLSMLTSDDMRNLVGSDAYVGGMLDKSGGHVHPLKLALGEADALTSLGGKIYEQSQVVRIDKGASPKAVTAHGSVQAKYMVLTGNAYLGDLAPNLTNKAIPCGTQVIATQPLTEEQQKSILPSDYCVEDCKYLLDYFRLSGDKRLLFGGGVVYGAKEPDSIERVIRPKMEAVFPQLKGIGIDYSWTGNFLLTYSRMPQFGCFDDNIYYLQGYSGHGVTCTHLAGKLLAETLTGHAERFDVFASLKHYSFPGGRHLQVPFTAMGAVFYTLRDKYSI